MSEFFSYLSNWGKPIQAQLVQVDLPEEVILEQDGKPFPVTACSYLEYENGMGFFLPLFLSPEDERLAIIGPRCGEIMECIPSYWERRSPEEDQASVDTETKD